VDVAPQLASFVGRKTLRPLLLAGIAFIATWKLLLRSALKVRLLLTLREFLTVVLALGKAPPTRIGMRQGRRQREHERHQQWAFQHPVNRSHHSLQPQSFQLSLSLHRSRHAARRQIDALPPGKGDHHQDANYHA
jgi:hypothetical protein